MTPLPLLAPLQAVWPAEDPYSQTELHITNPGGLALPATRNPGSADSLVTSMGTYTYTSTTLHSEPQPLLACMPLQSQAQYAVPSARQLCSPAHASSDGVQQRHFDPPFTTRPLAFRSADQYDPALPAPFTRAPLPLAFPLSVPISALCGSAATASRPYTPVTPYPVGNLAHQTHAVHAPYQPPWSAPPRAPPPVPSYHLFPPLFQPSTTPSPIPAPAPTPTPISLASSSPSPGWTDPYPIGYPYHTDSYLSTNAYVAPSHPTAQATTHHSSPASHPPLPSLGFKPAPTATVPVFWRDYRPDPAMAAGAGLPRTISGAALQDMASSRVASPNQSDESLAGNEEDHGCVLVDLGRRGSGCASACSGCGGVGGCDADADADAEDHAGSEADDMSVSAYTPGRTMAPSETELVQVEETAKPVLKSKAKSNSKGEGKASAKVKGKGMSGGGAKPVKAKAKPHAGAHHTPSEIPGQIIYSDEQGAKYGPLLRKFCTNCNTRDAPSWRRSKLVEGKMVCNRCGIHERTYEVPRPIAAYELAARCTPPPESINTKEAPQSTTAAMYAPVATPVHATRTARSRARPSVAAQIVDEQGTSASESHLRGPADPAGPTISNTASPRSSATLVPACSESRSPYQNMTTTTLPTLISHPFTPPARSGSTRRTASAAASAPTYRSSPYPTTAPTRKTSRGRSNTFGPSHSSRAGSSTAWGSGPSASPARAQASLKAQTAVNVEHCGGDHVASWMTRDE